MQRILSISVAVTLAGAAVWIAKVAVIVATGGRITDEGVAAVLFGIGGLLLLVGVAGLAVDAVKGRPPAIRVLAAVAGGLVLVASVIALATLAGALVPATVPQYLTDEVSTVLASVGWSGVALTRRRTTLTAAADGATLAAWTSRSGG